MKLYMEDAHLLDVDGCLVAVDSNGWAYRGAQKCARELVLKIPTTRYLHYFMDKVDLLLENGLIPTLVFDGAPLPAKFEESLQRDKKKDEYLRLALEHESVGNMVAASKFFEKAVKVTPQMVFVIVQELKRRGIDYIIAPYEADAQLAFLSKQEKVEAIISDDSDMIPYGCNRVFFDLDWDGYCHEYKSENLSRFSELRKRNKKYNSFDLSSFTPDQIVTMSVFAGCDYMKEVSGIKIGKAYQLARDFQDYHLAIESEKGSINFPDDYCELFHRAVMTYKHQAVYNPDSEEIVHLSEFNNTGEEDLDYIGQLLPQSLAKQIATGQIDPCTRSSFEVDEWMRFNEEEQIVTGCLNKEIMGLLEAEEELQMLVLKSILLEDTWKIWCDNPCFASSSTSIPSSIHTLGSFDEFIRIYNIMPRPSQLVFRESLFCFREPEWEDPAHGGRWSVAIDKSQADTCWLRLLQAILGEEFDDASEIYGASLNAALGRVKMAIWTKNAVNKDLQIRIGKHLKKLLDYKKIAGYIFHEDAKKKEKGVKNKYTV